MNIMLWWVRRIVVFLLIGAIVNIAVAWGCAIVLYGYEDGSQVWKNPKQDGEKIIRFDTGLGVQTTRSFAVELWGIVDPESLFKDSPTYTGQIWWPTTAFAHPYDIYHAAGWPLLCVRTHRVSGIMSPEELAASMLGKGVQQDYRWINAIQWPWRSAFPSLKVSGVLPYEPIPLGFMANTLIYGTITAIVICGAAGIRRSIRNHLGRCVACGYPRGRSPVCTECGAALPSVIAK